MGKRKCGCKRDEDGNVISYSWNAKDCPKAQEAFNELYPGVELLLESEGKRGTVCGHWEDKLFIENGASELFTGLFRKNLIQQHRFQ